MPVAVNCACGSAWNVDETKAGKLVQCPKCSDLVAAPKGETGTIVLNDPTPPSASLQPRPATGRRCPGCGTGYEYEPRECPHCGLRLGTARREVAKPTTARIQPPEPVLKSAPAAWEVPVVLVLIGLMVAGALFMMNIVGCVVWGVVFAGVLRREQKGWNLAVGLSALGAVVLTILILAGVDLPGAEGDARSLLWIDVGIRILIIVLLVICKKRGAFFK